MIPHGILNLDKPKGSTSFRVVALVRKLSAVKKVGHAGTLDPLATGVLLVCLGQAARVSEYLMELPKTYRGTVRLGVATDTFDATGEPEIEVRCGKGTYIRTLADDLGRRLGCGGHLAALRRTAVGPFDVDEAVTLERLEAAFADGAWQELLLPLDYGLGHIPAAYLEMEAEKDVRHGCPLAGESPAFQRLQGAEDGQRCRAYGEDGSFVGILRYDGGARLWRQQKVFITARPNV